MGSYSLCKKFCVNDVSCGFKGVKVEIQIFGINIGYLSISSILCSLLELSQATEKMEELGHDNT